MRAAWRTTERATQVASGAQARRGGSQPSSGARRPCSARLTVLRAASARSSASSIWPAATASMVNVASAWLATSRRPLSARNRPTARNARACCRRRRGGSWPGLRRKKRQDPPRRASRRPPGSGAGPSADSSKPSSRSPLAPPCSDRLTSCSSSKARRSIQRQAHLASWWKVSRYSRMNSRPASSCSSSAGVVRRQHHPVGRVGDEHRVALLQLQPRQHFLGQDHADRVADLGQLEGGHGNSADVITNVILAAFAARRKPRSRRRC